VIRLYVRYVTIIDCRKLDGTEVRADFNDRTFVLHFVTIGKLVQKLKGIDSMVISNPVYFLKER
jgi:hypothetical protein